MLRKPPKPEDQNQKLKKQHQKRITHISCCRREKKVAVLKVDTGLTLSKSTRPKIVRRNQPLAEKTAAYSRHLYDIASGSTAEFAKAIEGQAADVQKNFMGLVDNAAKNAPAGSETAVAVMKSAVAAASNALESVQKAVKQATDVAEANFNAVAATAVNAAKPAAKKR